MRETRSLMNAKQSDLNRVRVYHFSKGVLVEFHLALGYQGRF
jgi:hypothetical protein